jgi:hypothetical protein
MKVDSTEVHLKMFQGHDAGRERRITNGRQLADVLYPIFKPKTVIDLGCGLGFFLSGMKSHGSKIDAVDNDWVKDLETVVPLDDYTFHDLNMPFTSAKRYGLATSFEVAEHLTPDRSHDFVKELCALSDRVAFGTAIPRQGGKGHINLRWQSDWAEMFAAQGYDCYDAIRPAMADLNATYFWFRQNALVFIKQGTPVPTRVAGRRISASAANMVSRNLFNHKMGRAEKTIARIQAELATLKDKG